MTTSTNSDPLGRLVAHGSRSIAEPDVSIDEASRPTVRAQDSVEQNVAAVTTDSQIVGSDDAANRSHAEALLEQLSSAITEAQAYAERWAGPYQLEIFRVALGQLLGSRDEPVAGHMGLNVSRLNPKRNAAVGGGRQVAASAAGVVSGAGVVDGQLGPIEKIARTLGVEAQAVARALAFADDGKFSILGRVAGKTKKELQTRYSLVYLYVKEIGLANRLVDIEELRALCVDQGCYDLGNFTGNFKKDVTAGLLREQAEKGSRNRRYMLSQKGLTEAAELLRHMVEQ